MYNLFKAIAFRLDAETAHHLSIKTLSRFPDMALGLVPHKKFDIDMSVKLNCGLTWDYPIGLAAGLDKNAECINYFSQLNFGAVEVGTVTPLMQEGNPKPRLFRLKEEKSLLNRMGFNNAGMETVFQNVNSANKHNSVLGINLGKNKITTELDAPLDYQKLYQKLAPLADYLVINVSSPNTPGLRDLQKVDSLKLIFDALVKQREQVSKPLFLKISPDMSFDDISPIVELCREYNLAGIVATNTTVRPDIGVGGISGKLIKEKSSSFRSHLLDVAGKDSTLDIIGVGGVDSAKDLYEFWKKGGKAMQLYTSFIYNGPNILSNIYADVYNEIKNKNLNSLEEYIVSLNY
jgi:dihydroorotate dehydrogenase